MVVVVLVVVRVDARWTGQGKAGQSRAGRGSGVTVGVASGRATNEPNGYNKNLLQDFTAPSPPASGSKKWQMEEEERGVVSM
ncbi:hypothetical protein O3P69_009078 [Scylla paramamosain]|uniref:Uncharacterized protein n=1 Tax=Scylla paramamosain TaxID=85552 RepID=A0AAW0TRP8_SCYPA